jgi:hypothetical protein
MLLSIASLLDPRMKSGVGKNRSYRKWILADVCTAMKRKVWLTFCFTLNQSIVWKTLVCFCSRVAKWWIKKQHVHQVFTISTSWDRSSQRWKAYS